MKIRKSEILVSTCLLIQIALSVQIPDSGINLHVNAKLFYVPFYSGEFT